MSKSMQQIQYSKDQTETIKKLLLEIPFEQLIQCNLLKSPKSKIKYFSNPNEKNNENPLNISKTNQDNKNSLNNSTQKSNLQGNSQQQQNNENSSSNNDANVLSWLDSLI